MGTRCYGHCNVGGAMCRDWHVALRRSLHLERRGWLRCVTVFSGMSDKQSNPEKSTCPNDDSKKKKSPFGSEISGLKFIKYRLYCLSFLWLIGLPRFHRITAHLYTVFLQFSLYVVQIWAFLNEIRRPTLIWKYFYTNSLSRIFYQCRQIESKRFVSSTFKFNVGVQQYF